MSLKTRQFYRFGEFCLDATAKVLLRGGKAVRLTPKATETLIVLASHPDQVLTKDELIEAIWKDKVVDEANLMQNIAVARKALRLAPSQPGYIETFPGRGYRMVGPILADEDEVHGPERLAPRAEADAVPSAARSTEPRRIAWRRWAAAALLLGVVAAIGVVLTLRRRPAQSLTRTPVERLDGKEYQSAISPDGRDVAFIVDKADGRPSYMAIKLAGQSQPVIVKSGSDLAYSSPAWSPDGKRLAFLRFSRQTGELMVAARDGSDERMIARVFKTRRGLFYRHLAWSPDGRSLAVDDATEPSDPFSIFLVSLATGARRQISHPQAHFIGDVEPRFSPDGRLSFIRVIHRSVQALLVARADGTSVRKVSPDGSQVAGQDWTADGQWLVFSGDRNGEFRLWRVSASKIGAVPFADPSGIYADAPIQIAIARSAPVLLYSVLRQDFNIWRFDLGAVTAGAGRWSEIINSSAQDASPQYSPDGREICFRSDRTGEEQIWVSAADGSNPQQVTTNRLSPSVGRWSPDGRSIVFNNSRDKQAYVATREGGKWLVRALALEGTHPVFSVDGNWIYMGRNDATVESIFRVPAAGGPAETVSRGHGLSFGTSRDGRYLYFVKELADSSLWRLSLSTGEVSKVLDGLLPYCTSCWAEGEKGIYYLGTDDTSLVGQALFFHSFHGGPDRPIADYPEPLFPLGSGPFSLSPDGRYLMCVRMDSSRADVMRAEPYR